MKLRNKKTGEIVETDYMLGVSIPTTEIFGCKSYDQIAEYDSLAKFNEEWEDYKPAEPLIKDEKIRKAVRAWAEAIGATKNIVFDGSNNIYSFYYERLGFEKLLIYGDNDLEECKRYTIAELCGGDEQ